MREIIITLTGGTEVSGTVTPTGEIWSPIGRSLTADMIERTRPANLDGCDNDLDHS